MAATNNDDAAHDADKEYGYRHLNNTRGNTSPVSYTVATGPPNPSKYISTCESTKRSTSPHPNFTMLIFRLCGKDQKRFPTVRYNIQGQNQRHALSDQKVL